jgi:signal transduction histidine kinase
MSSLPLETESESLLGSISRSDFSELVKSFTEITSQLERTHDVLRAEVAVLKSDLEEANERLRRSRSLAALGEMAAGIAHEIRNPLGAMALNVGILREDVEENPDAQVLCDKVSRSIRTLDSIVGDVLSFARDTKASVRSCIAEDLMNQALAANSPFFEDDTVRVEFNVDPEMLALVDPGPVIQALTNVVRNACEALVSEGISQPCIRMSIDHAMLRTSAEGGRSEHLRFIIEDNGLGIPLELRERIFNPFFTTRETGTGLGLAIVHRIVDAHGGTLSIEDASPGARIILSFPAVQDMANQDPGVSLSGAVLDRIDNYESDRSTT